MGLLVYAESMDSSFFLPFFFPAALTELVAGLEKAKNLAGKGLRLIQIRFATPSLKKSHLPVKMIHLAGIAWETCTKSLLEIASFSAG